MKGLIVKEFYRIKSNRLLVFGVFLTVCLCFNSVAPAPAYISLFWGWSGYLAFSEILIEKEADKRIDLTLPVSKAEIVSLKYIIALIPAVLGVVTCLISGAIMLLTSVITVGEYLYGIVCVSFYALPLILVLTSFFALGEKKSKIICYILFVPIFLGQIYYHITVKELRNLNAVEFICIMAAAVALYALLWWVSVKAYSRREL